MSKETDRLLIKSALGGTQHQPGSGIMVDIKNEQGESMGTLPIEIAQAQQLQRIAVALENIAGLLQHVSIIMAPEAYAPQDENAEGYPIAPEEDSDFIVNSFEEGENDPALD